MSFAGAKGIPKDEMEIAADGFDALQSFFTEHPQFQERPLFITGPAPTQYQDASLYIKGSKILIVACTFHCSGLIQARTQPDIKYVPT